MGLLDVLRKLGVVRYGVKKGTYRSGRDRPIEFMMDGVYNADKELVTKADIRKVVSRGRGKETPGPVGCPACSAPRKPGAGFCGSCGAPAGEAKRAETPQTGDSRAENPRPEGVQTGGLPTSSRTGKSPAFWVLIGVGSVIGLLVLLFVLAVIVADDPDPGDTSRTEVVRVTEGGESQGTVRVAEPGPSASSSGTAPGTAVSDIAFREYVNKDYGFASELPSHWLLAADGATYVFAGPEGTEQYLTTFSFQVVDRTSGSSLKSQAEDLARQVEDMPEFKLEGYDTDEFQGLPLCYMAMRYQAPGLTEVYLQMYIIIERGSYYYYMTYTSPVRLTDKYMLVLERAASTFRFLEAEPGTSQPTPPAGSDEGTGGELEQLGKELDKLLKVLEKLGSEVEE